MSVLLLLAMFCMEGTELHIAETELYQVMRFEEVFVQPNGEIFLLNFEERRIQHYAADGSLKATFGRKGRGPGEFTYPSYINLIEEKIYLWDELSDLVSSFTLDGTFLKSAHVPVRGAMVARGSGGWFFFDRKSEVPRGTESVLEWAGESFDERKKITKISSTGWGRGVSINQVDSVMNASFSPISARPFLKASPDGSRVYLSDAELFLIHVFDGKTGKLLYKIDEKLKRIPFDNEWAEEEAAETIEHVKKRFPNVKLERLYPDYFPMIRNLFFDVDGNLVVDRWMGRPDDNHQVITYDAKGKKIANKNSWDLLRRLAGVAQGHAYIITYEEDGDSGIAKVPVDQADAFVKKNLIDDWHQSRQVMLD